MTPSGRHAPTIDRASVLPSQLVEYLRRLEPCAVVARAGNGVVYTDRPDARPARTPSPLERRLKATLDPHDILSGVR